MTEQLDPLTHDELDRLLAARTGRGLSEPRNRALIALLAGTGISLVEALNLSTVDIDPKSGLIDVRGRRARELHAPQEFVHHLDAWHAERSSSVATQDGPWFCTRSGAGLEGSQVRRLIAGRARAAGLGRPVNPRTLRETYIARTVVSGASSDELSRQLGQANDARARRRVRRLQEMIPADALPAPPSELWELLLANAPCGLAIAVAVRDAGGAIADFRLEYINAFGAGVLGLTPDEATGVRLGERFPGVWDDGMLAMWIEALRSGTVMETRERGMISSSAPRWFSVRRVPMGDRMLLTYVETTDKRRAAVQGAAARLRWEALLDATADGVIEMDRDGRIVAANARAEQLLGMSSGRLIGRIADDGCWRAQHADGAQMPVDEQPSRVTAMTGVSVRDREVRLRRGDGGLAELSVSVERLEAGSGPPYPLIVVMSNRGPLRAARDDGRVHREALEVVLEEVAVVTVVRTPDGMIESIAGPCREILGVEPEELVGRREYPGLGPRDSEELATRRTRLAGPAADGQEGWFTATSLGVRIRPRLVGESGAERIVDIISRDAATAAG